MNAQDVVLTQNAFAAWVEPDSVLRDDGRIARDLILTLQAKRAQFAPRSGHPVAMMLDEWIERLERYAAAPLLPVPG